MIVGISEYENIGETVGGDDARALYERLSPIWGEDHIKLLVDDEASKANIEDAICNWLEPLEDEEDLVLFFFSGHGSWHWDNGNEYYLCPYDALADSDENNVSDRELDGLFCTLESQNMVVILNACLSGGFVTQLSADGRVIMTSCMAGELSWSTQILGHSSFSYYLLEAIDDLGSIDANGDYEISAKEIFDYVKPKVVAYTEAMLGSRSQHPKMYDASEGKLGLFCQATFDTSPNVSSLTVDGTTYSTEELPISFTWVSRSVHECQAAPAVPIDEGIQHTFTSWGDGNTTASRTISQGGAYTANYTRQYCLAVESAYGTPVGEGWYDPGSTATMSVTSHSGAIVRHVFTGWSGDITATTPTATVLMDTPKAVTANWRTDYLYLCVLIAGIVVVAGGSSAFVIWKRRRT
ncbi:MAG: caspase family protein [Dehalococcoidia bacterium]